MFTRTDLHTVRLIINSVQFLYDALIGNIMSDLYMCIGGRVEIQAHASPSDVMSLLAHQISDGDVRLSNTNVHIGWPPTAHSDWQTMTSLIGQPSRPAGLLLS